MEDLDLDFYKLVQEDLDENKLKYDKYENLFIVYMPYYLIYNNKQIILKVHIKDDNVYVSDNGIIKEFLKNEKYKEKIINLLDKDYIVGENEVYIKAHNILWFCFLTDLETKIARIDLLVNGDYNGN